MVLVAYKEFWYLYFIMLLIFVAAFGKLCFENTFSKHTANIEGYFPHQQQCLLRY